MLFEQHLYIVLKFLLLSLYKCNLALKERKILQHGDTVIGKPAGAPPMCAADSARPAEAVVDTLKTGGAGLALIYASKHVSWSLWRYT